MRVKTTLFVLIGLLVCGLWGVRASYAQSISDTGTRTDVVGTITGLLIYDFMQNDEKKDPQHTLLLYDELDLQATTGISGTLNRVAQYQTLDSGLKVHGLFYEKELPKELITAQLVYDGVDSYRFEAGIDRPESFKLKVTDQSVVHRLEHDDNDVNVDLNTGAQYSRTWQRTQIDADKSLTQDRQFGVYGGYSFQRRSGTQEHTFFEIHRFNCTDCHTVAFLQGLDERTEDMYAGMRAHFAKQQVTVDANVATSNYVNSAPVQTFDLGGPFGVSTLYAYPTSHDDKQEVQVYVGEGSWRLGAHLEDLDRVNQSSGQTLKESHLSFQGATTLTDTITLTAGAYAQRDDESVLTNLSTSQERLWLQAAWRARKNLHVTARVGEQDKSYTILGQIIPNAHDQYGEVRADYRLKRFYLWGKVRNDTLDHPYFLTDFASKTEGQADLVYTAPTLSAGTRYDSWYGSNSANSTQVTDVLVFVTRPFDNGKLVVNASYDINDINANNELAYLFSAPVFPALGSNFELFEQLGFPYNGQTSTLLVSATLPLGKTGPKKRPWRLSPSYRQITTDTFGSYLFNLPGVAENSAVSIRQNVYGLHLDIPLKKPSDRLGLGWDNDNWSDVLNASNSGTFNILNLYLTKRY